MADPDECQREDFEPEGPDAERFERAATAVVEGDLRGLAALLDAHPGLARATSPRPHRCTLLHYVAANGFEASRQRVPANAVHIADLLFRHGAQADVTCEFGEGGPSTSPLVSLVTSVWPHRAGLHAQLVEAFLRGGASVDGIEDDGAPLEFALGFGYRRAAQALVEGGARVEHIIHAAGVGDLARVRAAFDAAEALRAEHARPSGLCTRDVQGAREVVDRAFVTACRHGRLECAAFLLERGADLGARGDQGFSALHSAAWYGETATLRWLLERGAPLEVKNAYGGTVADGTAWGAIHAPVPGVDYPAMLEHLCSAGADVSAVGPFPTGDERIDAVLARWGRE